MSGIINSGGSKSGGVPGLSNPLLAQTEQAIEAKLTPANRVDYMKIVVAGLHIALDRGANGFLAKLKGAADPVADVAKGAVDLMMVMKKEARGVMPTDAMVPAGLVLMLHGLGFIERTGVKIAEPELDRATQLFANNYFHRIGVTPAMLENATRKVHQIAQDPDAMNKIMLKGGMLRHPDAAQPTQIPGVPT